MTIASEIQRIKTNIANAYTVCDDKGATMPTTQNSANLANCINSIQGGGGGNIESSKTFTVDANTSTISTISPSTGYDGMAEVTADLSYIETQLSSINGSGTVLASKYNATINDILGDKNANSVLQHPATNCNLVFTDIRAVASYVLAYKFYRNPAIQTVNFPDLIQLTYTRSLYYAFSYASNLTSVSFPKLKTIAGSACLAYAFTNTALTTLSFPALTNMGTDYTNQFTSMLQGVSGCTVHFPSAMQSTIGSWDSVTDGFGGTNTTVLFDLTATT